MSKQSDLVSVSQGTSGNLTVASTGDASLDIFADSDNNGTNQWPILNFRINALTGTPAARIYQRENVDSLVFDNNGAERMRIDNAGRVTMPYQPAFQVQLSSTQNISANVRTKVAFDTIDYQNGNNYNTTNRRFTAPVTGFYQFNAIVYAYTVNNHEVTLWKNGSVYIRSQFQAAGSVNPVNGVLVAATKLTAGDYVEIYSQTTSSATIYDSHERPTTWSGFLIG